MATAIKSLIVQADSQCEMAFLEKTREECFEAGIEIRYDPEPCKYGERELIFVTLVGEETICEHFKQKLSELRDFESTAYAALAAGKFKV